MADRQASSAAKPLDEGDRVVIVGAADFNGQEGEVAWLTSTRTGVWIDGYVIGRDMPTTFLHTEVSRV